MLYDLVGAILSLLCAYYFVRIDLKAWPIGLFATVFNGWLYWKKGIYADMFLQLFYFINLCYGWHRWAYASHQTLTTIRGLSIKQCLYLIITIVIFYTILLNLLLFFSSSSVAKLDAITTILSIIAQGLMCYKMIATWIVWLVVDVLYTWMYLCKDLYIHSLLMLVYIAMAIAGYSRWLKEYQRINPSQLHVNQTPNVSMV